MLVLVDEMTKQRSLGYAERAFMGEERCNDCENSAFLGNREEKGSDHGSLVEQNRDGSGAKMSLILIASLLVCCALPLILASGGAGLAVYSFLTGWDVPFIGVSILLLIFGAFTLYHRRHKAKTLIPAKEGEPPSPEISRKTKE
jgi:hypothetical protein